MKKHSTFSNHANKTQVIITEQVLALSVSITSQHRAIACMSACARLNHGERAIERAPAVPATPIYIRPHIKAGHWVLSRLLFSGPSVTNAEAEYHATDFTPLASREGHYTQSRKIKGSIQIRRRAISVRRDQRHDVARELAAQNHAACRLLHRARINHKVLVQHWMKLISLAFVTWNISWLR